MKNSALPLNRRVATKRKVTAGDELHLWKWERGEITQIGRIDIRL